MDKNNKLDKLLSAARETKPIISFEEASAVVKSASPAAGVFSSSVAKGMIALSSTILISAAAFYFYSDNAGENTQPLSNAPQTTIELAPPPAQIPQPETEKSMENTSAAEKPVTEKATIVGKTFEEDDSENVGVKFTEVKSNTLRTVTITNATGKFALKFGGEELIEIQLNNEIVEENKWSDYNDVVAQAKETITSNKKSDDNDVSDKNFMGALKEQLIKDGLINGNVTSLEFNKSVLSINGNAVDDITHKRFLDFYKKKTGKEIGTTNFSIKGN